MRSIVLLLMLFINNAQDQPLQKKQPFSIDVLSLLTLLAENTLFLDNQNGEECLFVIKYRVFQIKYNVIQAIHRHKNLQELKCKSTVNKIKLLKVQNEAQSLSIKLQKFFAVVKQQRQFIRNALKQQFYMINRMQKQQNKNQYEAHSNEKEIITEHPQEFISQLQIQQNQLPYSSQKSMEKNRNLIINSQFSMEKSKNVIIIREKWRQLQQDYEREYILYMKVKDALLQELDVYIDLYRYYLRQIYKQEK